MIHPNEVQLCAALARHMLIEIVAPADDGGRNLARFRKGARFEHAFQGDFENASLAANRMRICMGVGEDGSLNATEACWYLNEITVEPAEFEEHLMQVGEELSIGMDEVVSAFVGVAVGFRGTLPTTRDAFAPPEDYRHALNLLALHGYAERVDGQYRWTDRIGPAMRDSFLWNTAFEDQIGQWDAEERHRLTAAFDAMPDLLKARMRRVAANEAEIEFVKVLARHWDGENWRIRPEDKPLGDGSIPSGFVIFARDIRALLERDIQRRGV